MFPTFGSAFNGCPIERDGPPRFMVWRTRDLDEIGDGWTVAYGTPRVHVIFDDRIQCWHRAQRAAVSMRHGGTPSLKDCITCRDTAWAQRFDLSDMLLRAQEVGWPARWKTPGRPIL